MTDFSGPSPQPSPAAPDETAGAPAAPLDYGPPPGPTLSQRTFRGFGWLTVQTVASKAVNFASQVVLAWLLGPRDWGLVGLAYTVAAFAGLLQQAGVREVLVRRQSRFRLWSGPAFWMSLSLGVGAAVVMAVAAPLVAAAFRKPQLVGLIWVLAAAAPLQALGSVPAARLQVELRFGAIAAVAFGATFATAALTVVFAKLGFEAYSFVLPVAVVALFQSATLWLVAASRLRGGPRPRRWRFLVGDSSLLLASAVLTTLVAQGDYVVLGLLYPESVVGLYYYAFILSMQAVGILVSNVADVLFPVLSTLRDDPQRQDRAFLRAARMFMLWGSPACLLQAAAAGPVMRWLFKAEWEPAIVLVQLLSVACSVRLPIGPAAGLMKAQGRFGDYLRFSVFNAVFFQVVITAGAFLGAATGVAAAMVVYSLVIGPLSLYVAASAGGRRWRDVVSVYAVPVIGGAAAVGLGLVAARLVPDHGAAGGQRNVLAAAGTVARLAVLCGVSAAAYLIIISRAAPELWREVVSHIRWPRRAAVAESAS